MRQENVPALENIVKENVLKSTKYWPKGPKGREPGKISAVSASETRGTMGPLTESGSWEGKQIR